MDWIFGAFLVASIIHMVEEYAFPGGFMEMMKRLNAKFAPFVTAPIAVIINGLQLLLCLVAILVGRNLLAFSLSVASLLFLNGVMHIMGCIRVKGYAPGVITGVMLYMPLSVYAYYHFSGSGQLTLGAGMVSGLLGLLYQAVPPSYFVLASAKRRV
jgi:hypothetical protein